MTSARLVVLSSDGHAGPPTAAYRPYVDSAHRTAFDAFAAEVRHRWTPEVPGGFFADDARSEKQRHPRSRAGDMGGVADPKRRIEELDLDGVPGEVIFPVDQSANTYALRARACELGPPVAEIVTP